MQASEVTLDRLPRGMREAVEGVLEPEEMLLAVWSTRGYGANALVCAAERALIAKRTDLVHWTVGAYRYTDIASVVMLDSRPGATQVELEPLPSEAPPAPVPFAEFPDAYYQESRRLVASNTVMFRSRRRAREAVAFLEGLVASSRPATGARRLRQGQRSAVGDGRPGVARDRGRRGADA